MRLRSEATAAGVIQLLQMSDSLMGEQTRSAMKLFREKSAQLGPVSLGEAVAVGGQHPLNLRFGGRPQALETALVDSVSGIAGGTATLFARQGQDFVRIATNVKTPEGQRAVGTLLNPQGKAYAALARGEAFYGQVDILGAPYLTGYEPIVDAGGKVVGAWYVGFKADLAEVESADLIIAASPVYRASYTGLFKHFVDFVGWDKLYDKPVLVAASGGSDRHALVLDHQLRPLFATMQANVLPLGVYASEADFSDYAVSSAALVDRIKLAVARALPYLNATK